MFTGFLGCFLPFNPGRLLSQITFIQHHSSPRECLLESTLPLLLWLLYIDCQLTQSHMPPAATVHRICNFLPSNTTYLEDKHSSKNDFIINNKQYPYMLNIFMGKYTYLCYMCMEKHVYFLFFS